MRQVARHDHDDHPAGRRPDAPFRPGIEPHVFDRGGITRGSPHHDRVGVRSSNSPSRYGTHASGPARTSRMARTECAPRIVRLAERRLVLSGIRETELDGVAEAYTAAGAAEIGRDGDGEWGGLVFATGRPGRESR